MLLRDQLLGETSIWLSTWTGVPPIQLGALYHLYTLHHSVGTSAICLLLFFMSHPHLPSQPQIQYAIPSCPVLIALALSPLSLLPYFRKQMIDSRGHLQILNSQY